MRDECKQFIGRRQDLCEGRGLDGRLTPPQHAVDRFRASKGLDPIIITETNFAPPVISVPATPPISKIGDCMAKMFAKEWGAIPCGECKRAIQRLNRMTVQEVQEKRSAIIKDIASRTSQALPQYWMKILSSADKFLHLGGTEYVIGGYVDRACQEETNAQQPI